ncbi:MAG: MATE family efflux transporter [Andreesenia angusta]|nr:MATE family efflux transporter [Andreesenia angusta]
MNDNLLNKFIKYVSFNVLGMLGLSFYILGDTFFVAQALGANGLAALNFSISIYSLMHGTGLMIGIGGAAKYSMLKSQNENEKANRIFTSAFKFTLLLALLYMLIGIFRSEQLSILLGADSTTIDMTNSYLKTILIFAPFYLLNNLLLAFVRNDKNPNLPMIAMIVGSVANVFLDYIFMFKFHMGMFGAAFATSLAPIISLSILSIHFIKKNNDFKYIRSSLKLDHIKDIIKLGLSAFITEISSAIALISFNLVILNIRGNLGVASYGIIANMALIGVAIFTGVAQGIQPLLSRAYGLSNSRNLRQIKRYSVFTSIIIAIIIYIGIFTYSENIISVFNSENNIEIANMTKTGFEIYFIGFFFAGINIVLTMYLSSIEKTRAAFLISISRGCVIIVPLVIILSGMWKMKGIWLAFVLTEFIVSLIALYIILSNRKQLKKRYKSI